MQGQEKIRDKEELKLIYLNCLFDMDMDGYIISDELIFIKQN